MSDTSQGPGWWQASDKKWYPPEQDPSAQAPPPPLRPTPGAPEGSPPPPAGAGAAKPSFSFDFKRLSQAERIVGGGTILLFISLFLPWFTYNFGIGTVSVDGLWHGWMYLVLLLSLAILAFLVLRAGFEEMPFSLPLADEQLLLIATGVNFVLTILAFLIKPGGDGVGWGLGAFLGLAASIVAVVPIAVPAIKARRT